MSDRQTFKIVLLGEGCVGKTSLVLRYCQNIFNESHKTTLQVGGLLLNQSDQVDEALSVCRPRS